MIHKLHHERPGAYLKCPSCLVAPFARALTTVSSHANKSNISIVRLANNTHLNPAAHNSDITF